MVHRDIKPGNIFYDGKDVFVADFGLAYFNDGESRPTETGEAVGARHFLPPEAEHGRVDEVFPTHDVYSLGKLLYWMISGKSFAREEAHLEGGDLDLRGNGDAAIHILYELLARTIRTKAEDRYENASELHRALSVAVRRIEMRAHVLDLNARQHCNYCGIGEYRPRKLLPAHSIIGADGDDELMSTNVIGHGDVLALQCSFCGNLQIFRLDGIMGDWKGLTNRQQ